MSARPLGGRDVAVIGLTVSLLIAFAAARSPIIAFAALASIVFIVWIATRAETVMLIMIAALPWEALLHYPSEALSLVKLLGLALAAAYVFRPATWDKEIRTSPIAAFALLFGLVGGLSLLVSPDPSAGFVKGFRYTFFIGFLFLVMQLVDSTPAGKRVLRVFCLSTALAAVYGMFSFLSGAVSRASGPIMDPNDFGYLMATTIPMAIYLYVEDRDRRPLWIASVLALLGGTFATLSRGAIVGLAALLLWAILTGRIGARKLVLLLMGAIVLIVVALTFWAPVINEHLEQKQHIAGENVESRESFWEAAVHMSIDHPLLGVGPARFGTEAPKYVKTNPESLEDPVVHDTYLEILAEDGPIALALFLAMLAAAWVAAARGESAGLAAGDESAARFATAIKGVIIVAMVSGIFLSEQVAVPIWLVCALAGSGAVLRRRSVLNPGYLGDR